MTTFRSGSSSRDAFYAPGELPTAWSRHADDYVTALAASYDGSLVAVATPNGHVYGLDTETGAIAFQCEAHPGGILALAFSPRTRLLASTGQDGCARLVDAAGRVQAELPGGGGWVEQLAWSPDGKRLATTSGKTARVWTCDGRLVLETAPGARTLTGVAWDRAGRQLATSGYGGVQLFDGQRGSLTRRLSWGDSLISLAWSPNDTVIACGTQECAVHFWRLATGKDSEISGFVAKPRALSWDSDGRYLATAGDKTVSVWSFDGKGPEGRAPILLTAHEALCTVLAFHPRYPRLASGGDGARVLVWDPCTDASPICVCLLEETVTSLVWCQSGRLLVASDA